MSFCKLQIPIEAEFELFKKFCSLLFDLKKYEALQRATFSAMGSPYFNKKLELIRVSEKNPLIVQMV